jgi:hypothetical protein
MARTQIPIADASVSREISGWAGTPHATSEHVRRAQTLDELEAQFKAIGTRFQALAASAGRDLCNASTGTGAWSTAQCLQHLNLSSDAYFPIWQQVIAAAGPRKAELNGPYRTDFWGLFLSWILEPPARIRSRTVAHLEPSECEDVVQVLQEFLERQERILAALRRCRGRAIDQVKIASPVDARIRYSIWSSFLVNAAHQRRHLWQAEQSIQTLSVPVR